MHIGIRMRRLRLRAALATLLPATAGTAFAVAPPQFAMPVVERGPELRGDLSDPAWEKAARLGDFVLIDDGGKPEAATEVRVLCDAGKLYVGFVCREPHPGRLVMGTSGRDGPVSSDDCVGLVLDVPNGKTWIYRWLANPLGTLWDAIHAPTGTDRAYDSGATARARVLADRWICELAIPFHDIGGPPEPGETWGINFCRERQSSPKELTSWSQAPAGFGDARACGEARFASAPGPIGIEVLSRGGLSADAQEDGLNAFLLRAANRSAAPLEVRAEVTASGRPMAAVRKPIRPGATAPLRVPYSLPGEGRPHLDFVVKLAGKPVYQSRLQAAKPIYRGPRTWRVPDPLYKALLSDEPPGLRRDGILMWGHLLDIAVMRETARRFAARYVADEAYQELARHRLLLIGHSVVRKMDPANPFARWGVRNVAVPRQQAPGVPWVLDPRSQEHTLQDIRDVLAQPHPLVWGVFAGDEIEDIAIQQGVRLMANPGEYGYIKEADAEVRRQFGGGVWGIPTGLVERDPSPYKWIAYRRWVNAKLRERHGRLREIVKASEPNLPIVSVDSGGGIHPYEWSAQADLFDVFTAQTMCRADPWRAQPGCQTKIVSDLTRKEFWPCAHVENYGMNTTPEEVVQEVSQLLRNGAAGLHLFTADVANSSKEVGDTRCTSLGSPRRWQTLMSIAALLRRMPRLRTPGYERTAVLFNEDTLLSVPYDAERPYADQIEACYTLLGPAARSWFRFVDCDQVIEWRDLASRFDLLYLPAARYQRPEVTARIREFAATGGTLICGDPQAFETDTLGNDTRSVSKELFGVEVGEKASGALLTPAGPLPGKALRLHGAAYRLAPARGTQVLGRYEDGSPAITLRPVGKGRAILFGCNPFALPAAADPAWRAFFAAWVRWLGAPAGLPIWRFQLPESIIAPEPMRPGLCLTNNHVRWREEKPSYPQNRETGGSYSYSVAPDAMPDIEGPGSVPFASGRLTDRRAGIWARKVAPRPYALYALPAPRWMVSWARSEPVSITFDLSAAFLPRELRLWFCDSLPAVTVEGSSDGSHWGALGKGEGHDAGEDVCDVAIPLARTRARRYVRAGFGAREAGRKLTLVEVEIWGEEADGKRPGKGR